MGTITSVDFNFQVTENPSGRISWNSTLTHRTRKDEAPGFLLAAGDGPDDDKRLLPRRDRVWQWGVGRVVGEVFFAGEEAQEGAAFERVVVAYGSA